MKKVIIISGPTAVGKTNISISLAKCLNGEIISADSVQVYKGFDIGSAKITQVEMQGIRHHLIDVLEPNENFDVTVFQSMASNAIDDICSRGKVPIIVGGTAFYIQALLYGINFTEEEHDTSYREELNLKSEDELYSMLLELDKDYALSTHKNNKKRVVRALEYMHYTGNKFSQYNLEQSNKTPVYDYKYFVLDDEREIIYANINKRVDIMIENGLLTEIDKILALNISRDSNSMQGIGYKEMFMYKDGLITLEEAVELIKKNTRHFAKRQLTWLRHEDDTIFINKSAYKHDDKKIVDFMITEYQKL